MTPDQLAELFRSSGIRRPVDDLKRLRQMLENSNLIIAAFCEDRLVGIARALTDFSYCCYLSDLAVAKEFQCHGIGAQLIKCVRERIGQRCNLVLLSAPEAMEYYPKLGVEFIQNGWILRRCD